MTELKAQRYKWLAAIGLLLGVALAAGFWVNQRRVGLVLDSYRL